MDIYEGSKVLTLFFSDDYMKVEVMVRRSKALCQTKDGPIPLFKSSDQVNACAERTDPGVPRP